MNIKKIIIISVLLSLFVNILNAEIILSFVGDVMTGSDYPDKSYLPSNEGKDIFKSVENYFRNSDVNFANLEGAIANTNTQSSKRSKNSYSFRMPPYMANRIAEAGFNIVAVANNHSRDFGDKGYKQTQEYLKNAEIKIVGNILNTATIIEIKNKKIGFLAFYYFSYANNSIQDITSAKALVEKTKKECDFLIVSFHGGAEGGNMFRVPKETEIFYGENRGDVYKFARAVSDAGADLIIGHGPHVLRAMEIYNNSFIAYSLGNFVGYKQFSLAGNNGISAILQITLNDNLKINSAKVIPIKLINGGIPSVDSSNEAIKKLNNYADLDFPNSGIKFNSEGEAILNK
ncbi:CapA family protein [Brachyspira aalborgi]|uniref:CapA family protein n=1 Tax=Brachyspira aalborgi TaxID=29522 RepID=A0A5C8FNI0_9SPIR|nr:CapA family protein [Brachyspira aalborgi]TXJ51120.1 CapA family protein [Brachyspira aalborgi]